jgi:hypothetical protein
MKRAAVNPEFLRFLTFSAANKITVIRIAKATLDPYSMVFIIDSGMSMEYKEHIL